MERLVCTATEAAELLGTSPNTVQPLLENGEIPAYKEGRNWKIPKTLLQKYAEDRAIKEASNRKKPKPQDSTGRSTIIDLSKVNLK